MATLINRGLSALVATTYLVIGLASGAGAEILGVAAGLLIIVLFIWYGDEIGEGMMRWKVRITAPPPGWLVKTLAWIILLTPLAWTTVQWIRK